MSLRFYAKKDGGKLEFECPVAFANAVESIPEGDGVLVTIERFREKTNKQLRYYWGVVIPPIWDYFKSQGTPYSKKKIHEFLKEEYNKVSGDDFSLSTAGIEEVQNYIEWVLFYSNTEFRTQIPEMR